MKRYCVIVAMTVIILVCLEDLGSQPPMQVAEIHCKHFLHGYPLGAPPSNDLIVRQCYALSANDQRKFADWVCYYLTGHEVDGDLPLDRQWHNDPWLDETETLEARPAGADDYREASMQQDYDRGHLAPLASFRNSRFAAEVNFYSNVVPMHRSVNRGPWSQLEENVRALVRQYGHAWVMAGPLYEFPMPALPYCDETHTVPSAFWKIVAVDDLGTLRIAAFIMAQSVPPTSAPLDYVQTVDAIERRSGLDFFRNLPDIQEDLLEAVPNTAWVQTWWVP
jgi:endonuclease G, mitochondrial